MLYYYIIAIFREEQVRIMDKQTFAHLEKLSKLNFSDAEKQKAIDEMGDIIALMDTIKEFDLSYDDTKDKDEILYKELRQDKAEESFLPEALLQNTESSDNCYVIPKMME